MTSWVNPTTRIGGVDQVVVAERPPSSSVDDAPYNDVQHVRVNGEWVPVDFPEIVPDTLAPSPPTGLAGSGSISGSGDTVNYALSWVAPTTNVDATPLTDLAYYVVRWRYGIGTPYQSFVSNDTSALLPGLTLGADIEWGVLARDISGNDSSWATHTTTGVVDTVGPNQPSIPILTTRLGTITATWDGLDAAAGAPPADFSHLEFFSSATTGGPWAYVDRVSGAGSTVIANVPVGETRFITTVAVDTSGNDSVRSAEASITVTGVTAPDMEANSVTANAIAAGSVAASKITTDELAAGVEIIAGTEAGNHAKMTDVGFKVMIEDPNDGVPNEVIRMGSAFGDLFAVTDPSGHIVAAISETGQGSFTGLSVDATEFDAESNPSKGLTIYGTEFLDHLAPYPLGVIAYGNRNTTSTLTTTEAPFHELQADVVRGRGYRLLAAGNVQNNTAGQRSLVNMKYTIDGTTPQTTSGKLQDARNVHISAGQILPFSINRYVYFPFDGVTTFEGDVLDLRVLLTISPDGGSGSVQSYGSSTAPSELQIEDCGPMRIDSGIDRSGGTPPPTIKNYVTTWNATNSEGYTSGGSPETGDADFKQGYSSADGDSYGYAVFAGNGVSGETTKTIASAMSGATLTKAEVYLYANHWYYNSGGTAIIRAYNSTSLTSSVPSGTTKQSASWPKPGGRWVDITSIATTAIRGISVGKAGSTNLLYYGRFNGHTQSNKPQLRLSYKR